MSDLPYNSRRSVGLYPNACISTDQPLASKIGLDILQAGGNAAEAAVAAAAALQVLQPGTTGLGGDCFCLFYRAEDRKVFALNGSGQCPANLTIDKVLREGFNEDHQLPLTHPYTVTVPGTAGAWDDCISLFGTGKVSFEEILEPAAKLAEEGFPISEIAAYFWQKSESVLQQSEHGGELLIDSQAPKHGDVMKNPKLAETLRELGREGKEGFYTGRIGQEIVNIVDKCGGVMTMDDMERHLEEFSGRNVEAISTTYRGVRVWEPPPNGQGLVTLMALNILEGFELKKMDPNSDKYLHLVVESLKLAFADGMRYIADPDVDKVPVKTLLSKEYAAERRKLIDMNKTQPVFPPGSVSSDTTYLSVVDSEGNACSFINSNYTNFGTGIVPKNCGFALHNRGSFFSLDPIHPNVLAPNKRPYHTIIPAMVTDDKSGRLLASYGVMGGRMQPQGQVQVLLNMLEFGMDPQKALDQPRIMIRSNPAQQDLRGLLDWVVPEEGISVGAKNFLTSIGHQVGPQVTGQERGQFGRGHVITLGSWWSNWTGQAKEDSEKHLWWAGTDPRCDGLSCGY